MHYAGPVQREGQVGPWGPPRGADGQGRPGGRPTADYGKERLNAHAHLTFVVWRGWGEGGGGSGGIRQT